MKNNDDVSKPSPKKTRHHWILWWKIEPDELQKQVDEYKTLKFYQSARGISALCLLFSVAVTAVFVATGIADSSAYGDAAMFLFLAIFVFLGHRWAIILAMALWTFEKGYQLYDMFQPHEGGRPTPNIILPLIWWTIYMQAFYLAFRVEKSRWAILQKS